MEWLLLNKLTRRAGGFLLSGLTVCVSGCILGPPLVNEDPINNHAPYIDPRVVRPAEQPYIAISSDVIELSVSQTYDEDEESELYYAFYSPELGILETESLIREVDTSGDASSLTYGIYNRYSGAAVRLNPCLSDLNGLTSVTVFFYLTDRNWRGFGINGVTPADDAFVSSHAWVIDLSNVQC